LPGFGLTELNISFTQKVAYKYVDENTAPEQLTANDTLSAVVNLEAGKKYIIYGVGTTSSSNVAIIQHSNNTYYVPQPVQRGIKYIEYTAQDGDVLYFTTYKVSADSKYYVAEVD
jgi:hypothetical protein